MSMLAAPDSNTDRAAARLNDMNALLAQNWWAIALRGIVAILFGLVALFMPGAVMLSLALLFAAYLLADGVFGIIAAMRAARSHERWGLLVVEGILNLAMGVIAALFPVAAVIAFVLVTAAWAFLTGGLMLAARLDCMSITGACGSRWVAWSR